MTDYLTVPEAAGYLRISARKVYDLVSRSGLPHHRAGGRMLFERAALAQWVRSSGREAGMPPPPMVLAGSHDALMDWAVRASGSTLATLCRGSRDGIERVRRGDACAALLHLPCRLDDAVEVERFNVGAVRESLGAHDVVLVNWCWRQQGLMIAPGNPWKIKSLADLRGSRARRRPKVGRRVAGAGSRELFDLLVADLESGATPAGAVGGRKDDAKADARAGAAAGAPFDLALDDLESENDAALAVRHGHVDVVFGAQSAARTAGLGFVPLLRERVDLLVSRRSYFEPPVQALLDFCRSPVFADYARALDGYDLAEHGAVIWNAT
jgi:excisionase family DNA binding protein